MTPGCRSVRSFLRAFLARGSADRLVEMSKEKMLQSEPSSYSRNVSKTIFAACRAQVVVVDEDLRVVCRCKVSRWRGRGRLCRQMYRETAGL